MSHPNPRAREPDVYLTSREVRARYGGCSDMTLHRWRKDPAMNFPQPLKMTSSRNLWSKKELEAWERRRAIESRRARSKPSPRNGTAQKPEVRA